MYFRKATKKNQYREFVNLPRHRSFASLALRQGRTPIRLSGLERSVIVHFYANPDFTPDELSAALRLEPGELSRLLRLKVGREMLNSMIEFAPQDFWPEYRLPKLGSPITKEG